MHFGRHISVSSHRSVAYPHRAIKLAVPRFYLRAFRSVEVSKGNDGPSIQFLGDDID